MYEVEIKFKLKEPDKIKEKIESRKCNFKELKQDDHIFVKNGITSENIQPGENILRIREENGKNYLTLKQRKNHLELETRIEDEKVANEMLKAMDYYELVEVKKTRLECKLNGFNLTIDNVDGIGYFMEIEKVISNENNIEKTKKEIMEFALAIGLTEADIENQKYDQMVLKKDKKVKHEMHLQSEPFEMIKVGTKTIEMRLYDEKRRKISIGDTIEFTNEKNGEKIIAKVINLYLFNSFKDLYERFDKKSIGYKDNEVANYKDMSQYYSEEAINKDGVIGIEIKI